MSPLEAGCVVAIGDALTQQGFATQVNFSQHVVYPLFSDGTSVDETVKPGSYGSNKTDMASLKRIRSSKQNSSGSLDSTQKSFFFFTRLDAGR